MGIRALITKIINDFFIITTGILIGMLIYGKLFDPEATFNIEQLQTIVFSGFITSVPTLIFYSKKELSKKQMLLRQGLHFILLESIIMWSAYASHGIEQGNFSQAFSIFILVFVIYMVVRVRGWLSDKKEAGKLNKRINEYNKHVTL
jgi:hypothetical protein